MVKLLRNGMHHPRGEMHFTRGRGFSRFPAQPHSMAQQMPLVNHNRFPHPLPPYLPPSPRGRVFPGPVSSPQFHNPHCPIPPHPFIPQSHDHRPFPPRPISSQYPIPPHHPIPSQHPIPPGPHRGDLGPLEEAQWIQSHQNGGQSFMRKPDHVKRLGVANGKRKQKRKSKPKERSEEAEINKPWMTEKLKIEISKKHKLYHHAKQNNTEENWAKYSEQRTLVGKISNAAKLEYIGTHKDVDLFFCEACDRGWKTEEALKIHLSEHRTCGLEGCTLSAHPKVIENHILQQHVTGLYKRITTACNPNDFTKWIAERKSRFPTAENIKKKQAQKEEMVARGERMPQNDNSKRLRDEQSFNRGRGGKKRRQRRKRDEVKKEPDEVEKEPEEKDDLHKQENTPGFKFLKVDKSWEDNWRGDLPQFPGTAAFPEINEAIVDTIKEEQFSDDEWQNGGKGISVQPLLMSQALASLCGMYASGSEDDDDEERIATKKQKTCSTVVKEEVHCDNESDKNNLENTGSTNVEFTTDVKEKSDSDSGPEEVPISHENNLEEDGKDVKDSLEITAEKNVEGIHEQSEQTKLSAKSVKTGFKGSTNYNTRFTQKRRRLTLLEKLLSSEIRHERNVILQCVRYVVQNNFFNAK